MLTIRAAQVDALRHSMRHRFGYKLVVHMQSFAPHLARYLSNARLLEFVDYNLHRADCHGLRESASLSLYVEFAAMFGSGFDEDPMVSWANDALLERPAGDEASMRTRLLSHFETWLARCPRGSCLAAMQRVRKTLRHDRPLPTIEEPNDLVDSLVEIYPEKCEAAGRASIITLAERSRSYCHQHSVSWNRCGFLFSSAMLMLGSDCFEDPALPWLREHMNFNVGPDGSCTRLRTRSALYLDAVLRNIGTPSH